MVTNEDVALAQIILFRLQNLVIQQEKLEFDHIALKTELGNILIDMNEIHSKLSQNWRKNYQEEVRFHQKQLKERSCE